MIDYGKFQMSLKRLEEQYEHYRHLDQSLPDYLREAMDESIIQRFEVCFDCAWKALKRHLAEDLAIADLPNSPKPILRLANENGLLDARRLLANENGLLDARVADWLTYADQRVDTSHDYSIEKAEACLDIAEDFIDDAIGLYQTMTGETWD